MRGRVAQESSLGPPPPASVFPLKDSNRRCQGDGRRGYYGTPAHWSPALATTTARYGVAAGRRHPARPSAGPVTTGMGLRPSWQPSSSPRAAGTSPSTSQPLHDPYEIASCSAAPANRHDHLIMAGYVRPGGREVKP